jgi:dihydropteroate synthase
VGHSRKRFLAVALGVLSEGETAAKPSTAPQPHHKSDVSPSPVLRPQLPSDRTAGTIGVTLSLARQGVQIVRVHDVAAVRQALLLFQATGGLE